MLSKVYHHSEPGKTHRRILDLVQSESVVLEVGCATGCMTKILTNELHCNVTAVEIDLYQAELARKYANKMITGSVCDEVIRRQIGKDFDYVLFADVLEHLLDPGEVLRWTRSIMSSKGQVIVSVPNVAYRKVRWQLLRGRWDYTDFGILDNTHLRFFTQQTFQDLFDRNGYQLTNLQRIFCGKTDRRFWRLCPNAFTYQFVGVAVPK